MDCASRFRGAQFFCIVAFGKFNGDFGAEGAVTIQAGESRNAAFNVNVTGCTFNSIPATSHKIAVLFTDTAWTLNTDLPTGDVWWRDL